MSFAVLTGLAAGPAVVASADSPGRPQFSPNPGSSGGDRSVRSRSPSLFPAHHPSGTDSSLGSAPPAQPAAPQRQAAGPVEAEPQAVPAQESAPAGPAIPRAAAAPPKARSGKPHHVTHRRAQSHPAAPSPRVKQRVSAVSLPRRPVEATSLPALTHAGGSTLPWLVLGLGVLGSIGLITVITRRRVGGGDGTGALAAYRRADARGDARGSFNLGCLLAEHGDTAGAVAALRRADARGDAAGASNLGVLMEQQGDLDAAHAAYSRADQRGYAHGSFNLGLLLERCGDDAGAQEAYRRAATRGGEDVAKRARAALAELRERAAG